MLWLKHTPKWVFWVSKYGSATVKFTANVTFLPTLVCLLTQTLPVVANVVANVAVVVVVVVATAVAIAKLKTNRSLDTTKALTHWPALFFCSMRIVQSD